jgi:hypothetical protein
MPDEPTEPVAAPPDVVDGPDPKTPDAAYVARLKAEAIANRKRAQEAEAKAAQWDAQQEASKTELQKAQEQAAQSERRATELQQQILRTRIATEKGLPPVITDRLTGSSEEELAADADRIIAELGKSYAPRTAEPKHTGAGMTDTTANPDSMTPQQLVEMVRNRGR